MRVLPHLIASLFILLPLVATAADQFEQNESTELKVGVRAINGIQAAQLQWSETTRALSNNIKGYHFTLVPIVDFEEMRKAVANKKIDFVLTNPLAYVDLNQHYGATRILTLNKKQPDGIASSSFSSVIFTHADNTDINQLKDIKNKSIMGVHPEAFGGWKMAFRELLLRDINPYRDSSIVKFSPNNAHLDVILAVLKKEIDVGTVRSGLIEKFSAQNKIEITKLKILNQHKEDDLTTLHSTQHYPEWPFATLSHVSNGITNLVFQALISIKPESKAATSGGYLSWTAPLEYNEVNQLISDIKYRHATFENLWKENKTVFLLSVSFLLAIIIYSLYLISINSQLIKSETALTQHREHLEELIDERTEKLNVEIKKHLETENQLAQAKKAAEHANLAKSDFLSQMSHEMKTPLNAILGFGQLIKMDTEEQTVIYDNTREILSAGKHLLSLINEILDLSKIESGRSPLNIEAISCEEALTECIAMITPLAQQKQITIDENIVSPCTVMGDKNRLKQICINLLSNAIKYNKYNGEVSIRIHKYKDKKCEIIIADTGVGMDENFQKKLFQPFARADKHSKKIEGTGLGLAICRKLITDMNGEIHITSEVTHGTKCRILLPTAQEINSD